MNRGVSTHPPALSRKILVKKRDKSSKGFMVRFSKSFKTFRRGTSGRVIHESCPYILHHDFSEKLRSFFKQNRTLSVLHPHVNRRIVHLL